MIAIASRKEELRIDVNASDNASKTLDSVADKAAALESAKASVEVDAEDNATETIDEVAENVETLDGETAEAELTADDEASEVVTDVTEAVEGLDGATAEAILEADDQATDTAVAAEGVVADFDGLTVTATLDAVDEASEVVDEALGSLDAVDDTFTATIEVEGGDEAETATGGIVSNLGRVVGAGGLAALSAAGLVAIGEAAADSVLDIKALADATGNGGDSALEQASRLNEVWDLAGGSTDSLEKNIIRVNDRLRESPELAATLGIQVTENKSAMDLFIEAVTVLNSGQLTSAQRLSIALDLFGAKGVAMLNDLNSRVGDLGDGMAAVGDEEIITQDDVDAALDFKAQMDAVSDVLAEVARDVLPSIAGAVRVIGTVLGSWPVEQIFTGLERGLEWLNALLEGEPTFDPTVEGLTAVTDLLGITGDQAEIASVSWANLQMEIEKGTTNSELASDALAHLAFLSGKSEDEILALASGVDEAAVAEMEAAEAVAEATEAIEAQIGVVKDHISVLEDQRDQLLEQAEAIGGTGDAYLDERDAIRRSQDALDDYHAAMQPVENDTRTQSQVMRDQQGALDDLVGSIDAAADATVERVRTSREAEGADLSEIEALETKNTALLNHASTLNGPEREAVLAHILRINGIPESRITTILSDNDPDDLAQVERELNQASRARQVLMNANASAQAIWEAEQTLAWLARPRTVTYTVNTVTSRISRAHGDPHLAEGGVIEVGEQGRELVALPRGSEVIPNHRLSSLDGGSGAPIREGDVIINLPAGTTSSGLAAAARRHRRRNGPIPLLT